MEVYMRVHRVEVEDDDGNVTYEWVDQRSSDFFDDYAMMKEKFGDAEMTSEQDDLIFHQLNHISKQNYGFGNQPALSSSSSIALDNEEVTRIKQLLEQSEKMIKEIQEERKHEQVEAVEQLRLEKEEIERLRPEQIERDEQHRLEQIERDERLRVEFEERLHRERVQMNQLHEQMQGQIQAQSQMQAEMSRMMATFVRQSDTHPPLSYCLS